MRRRDKATRWIVRDDGASTAVSRLMGFVYECLRTGVSWADTGGEKFSVLLFRVSKPQKSDEEKKE